MAKKEDLAKKEAAILKKDELANILADALNKQYKDSGNVAFFLSKQDDPSIITEWVSTGIYELDLAISNRANGGIPAGRITEITGLEASGKSLLSANILAETQRKGGQAIFIDTENAVSDEFMRCIGVDTSKLLYVQHDTVEDIFNTIEMLISKIRAADKDRLVTIVVDSVAAASCKTEVESEHGKDGFATGKAIIISKAMRKITNMIGKQKIVLVFTNQLRQNIGAMFGEKYTTSGGKAIAFHSSVRLRLSSMGKIKKSDDIVGIKTKAVVIKNRMGPPFKKSEFEIYFNRGLDNVSSWLNSLKSSDIIKGSQKLTYTKNDGEIVEFSKNDFTTVVMKNEKLRDEIYQKWAEYKIMKYKEQNSEVSDDVELANEDDDVIDDE